MHRVWNLSTLHIFKKEEYKKSSATKKNSRKFQEHCVQKSIFQGFYNVKKIQKQFKVIKEFK